MKSQEFSHILAAIILLAIVSGFTFALNSEWELLITVLAFSVIVIAVSIFTKKIIANLLDADVEHEIWKMKYFGFYPSYHLQKQVPAGIIFPLFLTLFSLGMLKFSALLTYETRALKYRAAKRHGFYSFSEMTDWHNCLIGASGIFFILLLSFITYFLPFNNMELLSKMAAYYAFWNLFPISKLDGAQIFYGSRILWSVLFAIAAIFTVFAITTV